MIRGMFRFHPRLFLFVSGEEIQDIGEAIEIFQYFYIVEHLLRFQLSHQSLYSPRNGTSHIQNTRDLSLTIDDEPRLWFEQGLKIGRKPT